MHDIRLTSAHPTMAHVRAAGLPSMLENERDGSRRASGLGSGQHSRAEQPKAHSDA